MPKRAPSISFGRRWHAADLPDPIPDVLCYWRFALLCFWDGLKKLLKAP